MEDGDPDGDWNDLVYTFSSEIFYVDDENANLDSNTQTTHLISQYEITITASRCTAKEY